MMMSSETRPPASMIFLASMPSGVPALTAALQHVAGGNLRNAELLGDEARLGTFTGAGRAEQDETHKSS